MNNITGLFRSLHCAVIVDHCCGFFPWGGGRGTLGSGSKRRVAKHRKSMKRRKKGLEEKGENTEMHF